MQDAKPFNLVINIEFKPGPIAAPSAALANPPSKGKEKVLEGYAFNRDGLLDPEAINIIDNGILKHISKEMGKVVINLDAISGNGMRLKGILELLNNLQVRNSSEGPSHAYKGFTPVAAAPITISSAPFSDDASMSLMSVDQMLSEMAGFFP